MSSQRIEDIHNKLLQQLLSETGIVCVRSYTETPISEETIEETNEEEFETEMETIPEQMVEPEAEQEHEVGVPEEIPPVFPSPSLRRVLPERIRRIEASGRIHTLPDEFKTDIDPAAIPKIAQTAPQKYIDILAEMVGCTHFRNSLAEYWFLDTLANLLRRAQADELDRQTQKILILWFCEWMKEIENFDAADRKRMLRRFENNMLHVAHYLAEEEQHVLPTPRQAGFNYKPSSDMHLDSVEQKTQVGSESSSKKTILKSKTTSDKSHATTQNPAAVSFGEAYDCLIHDLTKVIHYIYDLFSTDYQFDLVRSIFTFSPGYKHIDAPNQLQVPKRLYQPLKIKPKKEKAEKKDKGKAKGKNFVEPSEDYLALMALKAYDERLRDEQEIRDQEEWNKRSHILPLSLAATDDIFDKYWPPPPPPEPEPEPLPPPEPKSTKKGKK